MSYFLYKVNLRVKFETLLFYHTNTFHKKVVHIQITIPQTVGRINDKTAHF